MECKALPVYIYRADGTPGRAVSVKLKADELKGKTFIDVSAKGKKKERHEFDLDAKDSTEVQILLPENTGTEKQENVALVLEYGGQK